jgi:hypothetical protein
VWTFAGPLLKALPKRSRVVILSILRGDVQALLVFRLSSRKGKVKKNFYIILHYFSPFDSFCHWQALNQTWYRAGRAISDPTLITEYRFHLGVANENDGE